MEELEPNRSEREDDVGVERRVVLRLAVEIEKGNRTPPLSS